MNTPANNPPAQPPADVGKVVEEAAKEMADQPSGPLFESCARQILRRHLAPLTARLAEVERERDALKAEYESRAIWISRMNKILGYDNTDGFHSDPDPHQIAEKLVAALTTARQEVDAARSDLTKLRVEMEEAKAMPRTVEQLFNENQQQRAAITALQSALAQKEKDGERLGWLEAHAQQISQIEHQLRQEKPWVIFADSDIPISPSWDCSQGKPFAPPSTPPAARGRDGHEPGSTEDRDSNVDGPRRHQTATRIRI